MPEARSSKPAPVCGNCFRDQNIFQSGSLATDLESAVVVSTFVLVVQVDEQLLYLIVFIDDLL